MNNPTPLTDAFTKTELAIILSYGMTLSNADIASFFKKTPATLRQKVHDETFPIKPVNIKLGEHETRSTRLYDFRDVARYWDLYHNPEEKNLAETNLKSVV